MFISFIKCDTRLENQNITLDLLLEDLKYSLDLFLLLEQPVICRPYKHHRDTEGLLLSSETTVNYYNITLDQDLKFHFKQGQWLE